MAEFYYAQDQQQHGPLPIDQLRDKGIKPETLVWCEGMADWKPAEQVPELAAVLTEPVAADSIPFAQSVEPEDGRPAPPPPPPQPIFYASPAYVPEVERSVNRIAAGLCGIFLGAFGIHKFILGYNSAGLVMLLVSVLGGCCTSGVTAFVMGVIGLVEGIIYLTRTDEQFYEIYIRRRREWF